MERIKSVLAAAEKPARNPPWARRPTCSTPRPARSPSLLKDLKAQQAIEKLEQLAVELGYDPATGAVKSLAEIEGHIVSTFMELKKLLASMQANLAAFNAEAQGYLAQIADAPADYTYPNDPRCRNHLATVQTRSRRSSPWSRMIWRMFSTGTPTAAQLGHFQPLMLDIKKAYQAKEGLVGVYRGQVTTLANSIADYRQKLIEKSRINQIHGSSQSFARVKKHAALAGLRAERYWTLRPHSKPPPNWWPTASRSARSRGTELLAGSGVPFDRWKVILPPQRRRRSRPVLGGGESAARTGLPAQETRGWLLIAMTTFHLIGKLADNPRGKRLQKYLAATPTPEPPEGAGLCLASGQDYQTRTPAEQRKWLAWAARPGYALLLIPPFQTAVRHEPNAGKSPAWTSPPVLDHAAHPVLQPHATRNQPLHARGLAQTMNPLIDGGTSFATQRPLSQTPGFRHLCRDHHLRLVSRVGRSCPRAHRVAFRLAHPGRSPGHATLTPAAPAFEPHNGIFPSCSIWPPAISPIVPPPWKRSLGTTPFISAMRDVASLLDDLQPPDWLPTAPSLRRADDLDWKAPTGRYAEAYLDPASPL